MGALGRWDHDDRGGGTGTTLKGPSYGGTQLTTAQKIFGTGPKAPAPVIVTAPSKKRTTTSTYTSTAPKSSGGGGTSSGGGASGGSYADGYNKAVEEANSKKSNDAPQLAALQAMLDTGFAAARDTKLGNIDLTLSQQDKTMLDDYLRRAQGLEGSRSDNEKAEADSSFSNFANRARERGDILNQATAQGAGESDTLRSALMALRNWSANQADVNRSYYDTLRSVNSAITDLNVDTRTARTNLQTAANSDRESIWTNYYNQSSDALTQIGNIKANPNSDSYEAGSDSFAKAAEAAKNAWKSPGVPKEIQDWEGTVKAEDRGLNNTALQAATTNIGTPRKPEGATLRKW